LPSGWQPSSGEKVRYFLVASFMMIIPVLGLLFLGLQWGRNISNIMAILIAAIGGSIGLAIGTILLYFMALRWEQMALKNLDIQRCPNCKRNFSREAIICPHCDYEVGPVTQTHS